MKKFYISTQIWTHRQNTIVKLSRKRRRIAYIPLSAFFIICIGLRRLMSSWQQLVDYTNNKHEIDRNVSNFGSNRSSFVRRFQHIVSEQQNDRCAINFFGLPRAFESLVLPSIVTNVIEINPGCDFYVHYYHLTEESKGLSGNGGTIDPTSILLLRDAVHKAARDRDDLYHPIVEFVVDREEDFWFKYEEFLKKIRTIKVRGKYLYFPWKARYEYPTTMNNIVKMWHSIQSSFELMEKVAAERNIHYKTVAMLRSDVVYVTPIDLNDVPLLEGNNDSLPAVTIPDFCNYPVSDRLIYGPIEAVRIWATERFSNLNRHVQFIRRHDPGYGMHSEKFLQYTIFPLIRNITTIRKHPTMCFFRARADESVWVHDCIAYTNEIAAPSIMENFQNQSFSTIIRNAIGRECVGQVAVNISKLGRAMNCSKV